MNKHELKECRLFEDCGHYYLYLRYIIEDDKEVAEYIIPKVDIRFNKYQAPTSVHFYSNNPFDRCHIHKLELGCEQFTLHEGEGHDGANHVYMTKKVIETKTKKMTVAEIEKKLGYKIEIVSED